MENLFSIKECVTPILFSTRIIRLFAYGFISVILALYLAEIGLNEYQIGLLLSLTLAGDVAVSLWITTLADRIGRKRMLILGAALMVSAGAVFVFTKNPIPWCSRISRQIFCCAWFR